MTIVTEKCICQEQLGLKCPTIIHLSWCPDSYVFKEQMEARKKANWFKRLFMYNPENHPYGY